MSLYSDYAEALKNLERAGESFRLRVKLTKDPKSFTEEDANELYRIFETQERRLAQISYTLIRYLPELQRLENENEFMLKLINEHRIAE